MDGVRTDRIVCGAERRGDLVTEDSERAGVHGDLGVDGALELDIIVVRRTSDGELLVGLLAIFLTGLTFFALVLLGGFLAVAITEPIGLFLFLLLGHDHRLNEAIVLRDAIELERVG